MNPLIALALQSIPGFDLNSLIGLAAHEADLLGRQALQAHWNKEAESVVADMARDNWTFDRTTPDRPHSPDAYISDIEYRLWNRVLHKFGLAIDAVRDAHSVKIVPVVKAQMDPADPLHNVRAVIDAEVNLTL